MKNHLAHPSSVSWRLAFILLNGALLFALTGFSPPPQRSSNDASTAICYALFIPLWILAIWYWYRHYKVRGQNGALAATAAFIFSGLAVFAMIIDAPLRAIFSKAKFGPCPNCGKTKLIRENPAQGDHVAQPQCPHCKAFVGPVASVGAPPSANIPKQIEELQQLQDKNLITQEEFEKKKAELLSRM
jgi:predicted RNA-binding Zn-ribbon protein involved in translation (DUF1610 family)